MPKKIYLDYQATTPVSKEILEKVQMLEEFQKEWSIDRLKKMTIDEYSNSEYNSFTYCLEFKMTLPSIKGGSSYKFGIYKRRDTKDKSIQEFKRFEVTKKVNVNKVLSIDLGERIVDIRAWQSGHTDNDLSIYDKNTKTFWSENIFVKRIPSIRASVKKSIGFLGQARR